MRPRQTAILYNKYKDLIFFNKNIIIAGICSFITAALATQLYYTYFNQSHVANSIVALAIEYCVYFPLFGTLYYFDNRYRYIDPSTGRKNFDVIKSDIRKLFTAFSISEIVYSISKVSFTFQFLQLGALPYQASMFASIIASTLSIVLINIVIIRVVKLFRAKP
jgi:hypothetical protein